MSIFSPFLTHFWPLFSLFWSHFWTFLTPKMSIFSLFWSRFSCILGAFGRSGGGTPPFVAFHGRGGVPPKTGFWGVRTPYPEIRRVLGRVFGPKYGVPHPLVGDTIFWGGYPPPSPFTASPGGGYPPPNGHFGGSKTTIFNGFWSQNGSKMGRKWVENDTFWGVRPPLWDKGGVPPPKRAFGGSSCNKTVENGSRGPILGVRPPFATEIH